MTRLIAFDLETTGLEPERDRIIEFTFIEVDEKLEQQGEPYTALVNPGRPVPKLIQDLTGIPEEDLQGAPGFEAHASRIQRMVSPDTIFIAHNHRFDIPFLHSELTRHGQPGIPADQAAIDTMHIERFVHGHGLEPTYARYFGEELDKHHRSEMHTKATVEVLKAQLATHKDKLGNDPKRLTQADLIRLRDPDADIRTWLDHKHCFYRNGDGVVCFGFSKHRDERVHDNESFLIWMQSRDFPPDTMRLVEQFIQEIRGGDRTTAAAPGGQQTLG